jgi:hypothetical protein
MERNRYRRTRFGGMSRYSTILLGICDHAARNYVEGLQRAPARVLPYQMNRNPKEIPEETQP